MKIFLFLLCFWFSTPGRSALEWNQSVKKSGSTMYACAIDAVMFPYLFNLFEFESIVSMTWTYHENDVTKIIGNLLTNEFMTTSNYFNKVTLNKNGNFTMQNVGIQDTGNYVLKIQTRNKDQSKQTYTKELSLVVSEKVMFKGNKLTAKLSDKADWNSDTESFSLSLTCGDFIFKNENVPINVEWINPGGSVKKSTKYSDGKFYLQLDNPVKGGQYVCKIPKKSLSTVCATSNNNTEVTVNVDEDKARIILLENDNKKLKEQDEKLIIKSDKLEKKLKDQDEKLNIKVDKLEKKLKEQDKRLMELISKINSRIALGCEDVLTFGSGKRTLYLPFFHQVDIYCDQDTDGGRWNVFQRRSDGSENFYRGWYDYRKGFGDPDKEFWLGLETLHQMTKDGRKYELRFDLEKQDGSKYYAVYDDFSIGSESEGYAVHFTDYRGNAGDSFTGHKNKKFTTKDKDQDTSDNLNCARFCKGAWWYGNCYSSNLNGLYYDKNKSNRIMWARIEESLKKTEMKFRIKQ